ncbi:MAG: ACT domain-containing protein [Oscillospiraceae bacterium]
MDKQQLVLVDKKVLPEVFEKVLLAKTYISKDLAKNSTDACKMAELSRSAFYKYKDSVFFYEDKDKRRMITYSLRLSDEPGVLSNLLIKLSSFNANILTVNQNIPVDRVAMVTISFRIDEEITDMDRLHDEISHINGVIRAKQI